MAKTFVSPLSTHFNTSPSQKDGRMQVCSSQAWAVIPESLTCIKVFFSLKIPLTEGNLWLVSWCAFEETKGNASDLNLNASVVNAAGESRQAFVRANKLV